MKKFDKVIVTNRAALRRKYGNGARSVDAAIRRLIAADKKRGMTTVRVDLDALETGLKNPDIASATAQRLTKDAIDKACTRYTPDYVMILGAIDVVVMQELANPMNADDDPDNDDEDPVVPSDLPYACEEAYSTDAANFLGPVRVVGRLPDIVGATKPDYIVDLLAQASSWKQRPRADYQHYFGLSAYVWRKSTQLSLENLFNDAKTMKVSPKGGPAWSASALAPRIHFINCHGSDRAPRYYGQRGESYPTAHFAAKLDSKVEEGTVLAAECCYGAQLYDPAQALDKRDAGIRGIAVTYLADGAYGVFGSTTIAYGPSEGNGQADLICQYFVRAVRDGASLGRAALEARHRFASQLSHLDPSDLKTLVQFYLLGDPSIQPVEAPGHALYRSRAYQRVFGSRGQSPGSRFFRRERAARAGRNLSRTLGAVQPSRARVPLGVRRVLGAIARESRLEKWTISVYKVMKNSGRTAKEVWQRRIYALTGAVGGRFSQGGSVISIIATTEAGEIVHLRRVRSR
jgi:Peptidase family C25